MHSIALDCTRLALDWADWHSIAQSSAKSSAIECIRVHSDLFERMRSNFSDVFLMTFFDLVSNFFFNLVFDKSLVFFSHTDFHVKKKLSKSSKNTKKRYFFPDFFSSKNPNLTYGKGDHIENIGNRVHTIMYNMNVV